MRMLTDSLVEEIGERPDPALDDECRRWPIQSSRYGCQFLTLPGHSRPDFHISTDLIFVLDPGFEPHKIKSSLSQSGTVQFTARVSLKSGKFETWSIDISLHKH